MCYMLESWKWFQMTQQTVHSLKWKSTSGKSRSHAHQIKPDHSSLLVLLMCCRCWHWRSRYSIMFWPSRNSVRNYWLTRYWSAMMTRACQSSLCKNSVSCKLKHACQGFWTKQTKEAIPANHWRFIMATDHVSRENQMTNKKRDGLKQFAGIFHNSNKRND